jgi:hypothetical protein
MRVVKPKLKNKNIECLGCGCFYTYLFQLEKLSINIELHEECNGKQRFSSGTEISVDRLCVISG